MIDLRFVIRDGKRILQWRQETDPEIVHGYNFLDGSTYEITRWTDWVDVRTEEE